MRVSFIVPAFNEAATVCQVLDGIRALEIDAQVVVADDGSVDGTADVVARWNETNEPVAVLRLSHRGKGAAIRAAIPYLDGDIVVIQDADLEYDPADVPSLIEPIERGVADVVLGSRLASGRPHRVHLFWHLVGNRLLSFITNVLYDTAVTDMETGYKAFRIDVLRSLRLTRDDFGIEPELVGEVARRGYRIYELPVAYYGRGYAEGKKITWRDGVKAVGVLVTVRARRARS